MLVATSSRAPTDRRNIFNDGLQNNGFCPLNTSFYSSTFEKEPRLPNVEAHDLLAPRPDVLRSLTIAALEKGYYVVSIKDKPFPGNDAIAVFSFKSKHNLEAISVRGKIVVYCHLISISDHYSPRTFCIGEIVRVAKNGWIRTAGNVISTSRTNIYFTFSPKNSLQQKCDVKFKSCADAMWNDSPTIRRKKAIQCIETDIKLISTRTKFSLCNNEDTFA
jgi:hypothetical protein